MGIVIQKPLMAVVFARTTRMDFKNMRTAGRPVVLLTLPWRHCMISDRCGFDGRGANGHSNDWRMWDGIPMGYEWFLVDKYYTLLAVPLRTKP